MSSGDHPLPARFGSFRRACGRFVDHLCEAVADATEGREDLSSPAELAAALRCIAARARTSMALTLAVGDKASWRGPHAAAAYQRRGNLMVILHDPACDEPETSATIEALQAAASACSLQPVFYLCTPGLRSRLVSRGYRSFNMGAEGIVDLVSLDTSVPSFAYLRRALRHAASGGIDIRVQEPPIDDRTLSQIAGVNDRWLAGKRIREFRFSQGFIDPVYLRSMPLCVARMSGRVVGFCNLLCPHVPLGLARAPEPGTGCREVMVDLMRSDRGVSWSLAHAIWLTAMLWARDLGYERFNMGMAPLAGTGHGSDATCIERLARRFAEAGGGPIDQGLHQFKSMYRPAWEPRYLCWRGRLRLPWVFWQTSSMVLAMSAADRQRISRARWAVESA